MSHLNDRQDKLQEYKDGTIFKRERKKERKKNDLVYTKIFKGGGFRLSIKLSSVV